MTIAFRQSRYDRESELGGDEGDYINCPLNKEEYARFVQAVLAAPKIELKGADKELERYFEGCMPIEALASARRASRWPLAPCARWGCATRARAAAPTPWCSCARTMWPARSTTWWASRPT